MHESGESISKICKELGIHSESLTLWTAIYKAKGAQGLCKHNAHKSADEKLLIVKDILNNELSLTSASKKYLVAIDTLKMWIKAYRMHGAGGLHRKNEAGKVMSKKKRAYTEEELDELEQLRRRNEWLEAENALLKKVKALVEEREARQRATGRKPSKD